MRTQYIWKDFSELSNFTPKQVEATQAADAHRYTLFGGARGPGKSYWLRWYLLRLLIRWGWQEHFNVRVGLFCEDYPALHDRQLSKIRLEFPPGIGSFNEQKREFTLRKHLGAGVLCFRNLDKPEKYQSAEFAAIGVDELTKNTVDTFNILRGSMRWPGIETTRFVAATNPGDVGHLWVKAYWIDKQLPPELDQHRTQFIFIPGRPVDNPYLTESYWDELNSLPPDLQRAWVYGDWDVFAGQAFDQWLRERHVIKPFAVPDQWVKWRAVDWGYVQPFCCLWLAQDPDSLRIVVYRELYETGLTDRDQAKRILDNTLPDERIKWTLADPSMWTRKTYEQQTFSTADEYRAAGLWLEPADNDRIQGVRKVRQYLADGPDGEPRLQIMENCLNLIRTLPALPRDNRNPEDVDTKAEDHAYDALRYGLMRGTQREQPPPQPASDPYSFIG